MTGLTTRSAAERAGFVVVLVGGGDDDDIAASTSTTFIRPGWDWLSRTTSSSSLSSLLSSSSSSSSCWSMLTLMTLSSSSSSSSFPDSDRTSLSCLDQYLKLSMTMVEPCLRASRVFSRAWRSCVREDEETWIVVCWRLRVGGSRHLHVCV